MRYGTSRPLTPSVYRVEGFIVGQTSPTSQSRNPRFHSNRVLKLGRVFGFTAARQFRHQGWDYFLPPCQLTCIRRGRQTPNLYHEENSQRAQIWRALQFPQLLYLSMLTLPDISAIHDQFTADWHSDPGAASAKHSSELSTLIVEQHRQNFALWHEEDRARSPRSSAEEIAAIKRNIDALNQARNDLVEAIDRELLQQLPDQDGNQGVPLHSETPGMIIDRLSILSLKIFHTREEIGRREVSAEHVSRNRERLRILLEQRQDLASCLQNLCSDLGSGRRRFKLYRQLKMYNDPELNPEIYKAPEDY